ncbi:transposase [Marinisporobacter balticus]|uniref:transposase n=1 Tax=Marinisporobacter balticus TaxID=2018667 RepID=UPI001404F3FD|nr:transposase [Marinisporobacter balticus]
MLVLLKQMDIKYILPENTMQGIEAVSLDMSRSYCFYVLECLPNAKPVIDRFHISQHLHNCVDDARKHIQNYIRKYGKKDKVLQLHYLKEEFRIFFDLATKENAAAFLDCISLQSMCTIYHNIYC